MNYKLHVKAENRDIANFRHSVNRTSAESFMYKFNMNTFEVFILRCPCYRDPRIPYQVDIYNFSHYM